MKPIEKLVFKSKEEVYKYANIKLVGLVASEDNTLANLSNAAALLGFLLDDINWAGFYFIREGLLKLGPFQGKPACTTLNLGNGVCGTAAQTKEVQIVENVDCFVGHVACDPDSKSEIVFPIIVDGNVIGVLDVDSPIYNRFDEEDRVGLERIVNTLNKYIKWNEIV